MSTKKATEMIRYYKNPNGPTIGVTAKDVIESDGLYFKDLNGDGTLNTYKDWRKTPSERAKALAEELSSEEKIGLLFINSLKMGAYQEDKEAVFDAIDTVKQCLRVLTPMFSTMQILKDNMKKAALKGFINATDCADYLTKKGMPFRDAYKTVGQLVAQCVREDKSLADLTLEEYKTHSDVFENDVYEAIDLKTCVRGRKVIGGPAPEEVTRQISVIEKFVSEHKVQE